MDHPELSPHPTPHQQPTRDPWPVDVTGHDAPPCECPPPPITPTKPPCTRSRPKNKDCCETLLELNAKCEGDSRRKIHKPKTPPKIKLANWCCDWPVPDAIAPIMVLLFRRAKKGLTPANDFEKNIYYFLGTLDPRHREAFEVGVDAYLAIPDARRCGFETRFDDWPDDRPVDPQFISKVLAQEIISLGRYGVFNQQQRNVSPGEIRLWEQSFPLPGEPGKFETKLGPWPWICAVNPGADDVKYYRNRDVIFPDKSDINSIAFDLHEFSQTCTTSVPDPTDPKTVLVDCKDTAPLTGFAGNCDGGMNYNFTDPTKGVRCLAIPQCIAGQGIALRGFNFSSLNSTIVIRKVGGGFPDMTVPCDVMRDENPPTKNASCDVRDRLTFILPRKIRDGKNDRPVPPGRYTVELHVPNETNYAPSPGPAPTEFVSNTALINVMPPIDIPYQIWVERGNCYEETSGPGDDEPWFRSYTATYRPVGSQPLDTTEHDIFRQEDIESGDSIGFTPVTPFSGRLEVGGCVAIAITGLEVDSEEAAEKQVTAFGEAYGLYWQQVLTLTAVGLAEAAATIVGSVVVGGLALIVIAGIGLFYAAWAPADPIGYDLLVFDQVSLFMLTTPGTPLPLGDAGGIGYITYSTYPKGFTNTSATTAEYREERQYWAQEEESKYGLDFKINQLPTA